MYSIKRFSKVKLKVNKRIYPNWFGFILALDNFEQKV